MTDISDAADLTETAREALLRDVIPALPAERRYVALMIANALGVAAREQRSGDAARAAEAARLSTLLRDVARLPAATTDGDALPALRNAVREAIRAGIFDAPERAATLATALGATARDRVAISSPKALRASSSDASASCDDAG